MNRRDFLIQTSLLSASGLLLRGRLGAQGRASGGRGGPVTTEFTPIRRNTGYFTGRGGAIGWLSNDDVLVAIDTQFPDTAPLFLEGMPGRGGRTLDLVINTHHHGDHTGGNPTFRPVTRSILGHVNVPGLMRSGGGRGAPATPPVVPDTTFAQAWRTELGDEVISARYFGPAHTSGDIVTHLENANVVHLGDLTFNRLYPVIDVGAGGSFRGWLSVVERVAAEYPADAVYLFGHTHASDPRYLNRGTRDDVLAFRDYITGLLEHVEREIRSGRSRDDVTSLQALPGFDEFDPASNGRLSGNLGAAYDELSAG